MNPSVAGLIALILPAIPGLIAVAQILIKGGPNRMTAVTESLRTMLTHAAPQLSAPNVPSEKIISDEQLRIIIETVLAEQKRTGALSATISAAGSAVTNLATQMVAVPNPLPIVLAEVKK